MSDRHRDADSVAGNDHLQRFLTIGVVAAIGDTIALFVLAEVVGLLPELAKVLAIEAAIVVVFLHAERNATERRGSDERRQFRYRVVETHFFRSPSALVQIVTFTLTYRLLSVDLTVLGIDLWIFVASAVAIAAAAAGRYLFNRSARTDDPQEYADSLLSGVRFTKFASVGVVGALSDNVVLTTLKLGLDVPEMWAKAAGIETAILVMFLVNERWTFADQGTAGRSAFLRRLGKSHLVRSGGVTVQLIIYWFLTQHLTVELFIAGVDFWFLAASPIAIAIAMFVNYVLESIFTWQVHAEE